MSIEGKHFTIRVVEIWGEYEQRQYKRKINANISCFVHFCICKQIWVIRLKNTPPDVIMNDIRSIESIAILKNSSAAGCGINLADPW